MENKKVLIIEDLVATQTQLSQFYDKQSIQYEICKNFAGAYEKIIDIVDKGKLGEYEYILMDGELNGGNTDKFIEHLLSDKSVPPIISISASQSHANTYQLPYADKLGIIDNLKYILGKDYKKDFLSNTQNDHEEFKNRFDNREKNIITRKNLLETLSHKEEIITNEEIITTKQPFLKKIFSKIKIKNRP